MTISESTQLCTIRLCRPEDAGAIKELQEIWRTEDITYGFTPVDEDVIKAALGPFFLVAEVEGVIAGFVAGALREGQAAAVMPEPGEYLEVEDLYVAPSFRGQGVGQELLEAVLDRAREAGVPKAFIYSSNKDLFRTLKFYERLGFRPWFARMFCDLQ